MFIVLLPHTKEGNILFTDALNQFYLWFHGVAHTVKDNSDSKRGNHLLSLQGLLFPISSIQDSTYQLCNTGWKKKITQYIHHDKSFCQPITIRVESLPQSYISLLFVHVWWQQVLVKQDIKITIFQSVVITDGYHWWLKWCLFTH